MHQLLFLTGGGGWSASAGPGKAAAPSTAGRGSTGARPASSARTKAPGEAAARPRGTCRSRPGSASATPVPFPGRGQPGGGAPGWEGAPPIGAQKARLVGRDWLPAAKVGGAVRALPGEPHLSGLRVSNAGCASVAVGGRERAAAVCGDRWAP